MSIVSSEIVADDAQADGRRYIREHHTDDTGVVHLANYLGAANTNANAVMLARVPQIEENLAEQATNRTRRTRRRSAKAKITAWAYADIDSKNDVQAKNRYGFTNPELSIIRDVIANGEED